MPQSQATRPLDLSDLFYRAGLHHQRGEWDQAEAIYRTIIAADPDHFDALHLYGILMHQRGRPAAAVKLLAAALAVNAHVPAAHSNYGLVLAALGRYEDALTSYERAIALKPDYAEAFNNRGNALRAVKRVEEALVSYEKALDLRPDYPEALNNRGNALLELGRHEAALASYDAALQCRPDYADALVNRGQCLLLLKRADEALASFDAALALVPDHVPALKERGHLLRSRKQHAAALACYEQVLSIKPDDAETHANRGLVLRDLGRFNDAFVAYDRALALKPDYVEVVVARGNVFYEMGSFAEALSEYERALAMRPDFAYGFNNRGNALHALGRHDEALASYAKALALKPDYIEAHNNRANALLELNRPDEALVDYDRAVAAKPVAFALVNRGSALRYLGRHAEALASFDQAIALEPDLAEAHWNKALLNLSLGDYENGWRGYEWRWRGATQLAPRGFSQPQWYGEDIAGKTILLHAEQGYGDTLQFARYVPMVAERGARIVLEAPDALLPLLATLPGVTTLVGRGDALPAFDLHCPLMSLPLAFGTTLATIPARVPYLSVPPAYAEKWRRRLPRGNRPLVGLAWSGKATHKNDHNRTLPISRFGPILANPGIDFVSLQREYREADLAVLGQFPALRRIDDDLCDFADTAAAAEQCDLVISVDTAVAHLAGSLGKPIWILLSHILDWRWLLEREDSPWYPTARLFRQPSIGDWDSVIAKLQAALAEFAARRGAAN